MERQEDTEEFETPKKQPDTGKKEKPKQVSVRDSDCVILRTRMRRSMLRRVKVCAAHRATVYGESFTMSDLVKESLLPVLAGIETEIALSRQAGPFTGHVDDRDTEILASVQALKARGRTM